MPCQYTDIMILCVFKCMFLEICTTTCTYMCNFNIPTVLFWLFCWTVIKCTFCIYIRKRLYCPCSRTENKFNVYLKIDSDNGLGVPPRTNKTNKAWQSARVQRSLRFPPRNFINSAELRGILWMIKIMSSVGFLAKLKFSSEFCRKWGIRVECTVSLTPWVG